MSNVRTLRLRNKLKPNVIDSDFESETDIKYTAHTKETNKKKPLTGGLDMCASNSEDSANTK